MSGTIYATKKEATANKAKGEIVVPAKPISYRECDHYGLRYRGGWRIETRRKYQVA